MGGETTAADRTASALPAAEGQEADMSAITAALTTPALITPVLVVSRAPRVRD
jgi:hypothetical protein